MEVKDVPKSEPSEVTNPVENQVRDLPATAKSRSADVNVTAEAAVDIVTVSRNARIAGNNEARGRVNQVINVVNVAKKATAEISDFLKSINGLVDQAESAPEDRRKLLEGEGNEVVDAIRASAKLATASGLRPLAGDKIRIELEETLGRSLDVILPDDAARAFGLSKLQFSTKESIISTRAAIKIAEAQFEELQKSLESVVTEVRSSASDVDVAVQNSESTETSVRDVDKALKLAGDTTAEIVAHPREALGSAGAVNAGLLG